MSRTRAATAQWTLNASNVFCIINVNIRKQAKLTAYFGMSYDDFMKCVLMHIVPAQPYYAYLCQPKLQFSGHYVQLDAFNA